MTYLKPHSVLACISCNNNLERCKIVRSAILLHLWHAYSVFNTGSQFPDATHGPFITPLLRATVQRFPVQFSPRPTFFFFSFLLFLFLPLFSFAHIFDFLWKKPQYIWKKKKTTASPIEILVSQFQKDWCGILIHFHLSSPNFKTYKSQLTSYFSNIANIESPVKVLKHCTGSDVRDQNWNEKLFQEHRQLQPEIGFRCIFCKKKVNVTKDELFDVGL